MSLCCLSAFSIRAETTTDPRKARQPAAIAPNERADKAKLLTLNRPNRKNKTEL